MDTAISASQLFFEEKIFPYLDEIFNYTLLMNNDERLAEKQLINTCKNATWFSENLSLETDTRLWLLRITMNLEKVSSQNRETENNFTQADQLADLSKFERDYFERKGRFETTQKLKESISEISYPLRQVLVLIDFLKFSYKQAGDLIDVPAGVIQTRLYDARNLLLNNLTSGLSTNSLLEKSEVTYDDKKKIISSTDKNNNPDKLKFENEIKIQQYVKSLIENYIPFQSIRPIIQKRLAHKFAPQLKNKIIADNLSGKRSMVVSATLLMFILAIVLILTNGPAIVNASGLASKQTGENNFLVQLENNYNSFAEHQFDSLMLKINKQRPDEYLNKSIAGYNPSMLVISGWVPSEYFITNYKDKRLINLIYKNDAGICLYTFQARLSMVEKEASLKLTNELLEYLHKENCFVIRKDHITYLLKIISGNLVGVAGKDINKSMLADACNQKEL